jgi:glycogen(starch) synthase
VRLLYACESYRPYIGGLETVSEALLGELRQRGHDVTIVTNQRTPDDPTHDQLGGLPIRRLPMSWALAARRLDVVADVVRDLGALKHQSRPDVVHLAWSGVSDFFHWRSGRVAPTLVTLHAPLPDGPSRRHLVDRADLVVAVSASLGEFRVIPNGYPAPVAPLVPLPLEPVVLALGRMVPDKGFDLLVDAWPLVRARVPRARLILAGDGPERPRLSGPGVEPIGWIEPGKVFEVVDAARVVAVPSRWNEPFGLVALDAAWRERPVVAARRGGLVDIVDDGRTGLLVKPEDREDLAGALVRLLTDHDLARGMGRAARRRAQVHFSLARMVDAYESAYAQLCRGAPGRPA